MLDLFYALILGLVEGLTEFLPISSTGHLIVGAALLGFPTANLNVPNPGAFREAFVIFIQFGAVLALIVYHAADLLAQARKLPKARSTQRFWLNVIIASIPAGLVGFFLRDWIKAVLFTPVVVDISLIVGGALFLLIEATPGQTSIQALENVNFGRAIFIGFAQMIALIPGVSRSGASIIGGLLSGLDRPTATRFSFYLAMPVLGGATLYELASALRDGLVSSDQMALFAGGTIVAFIVALVSIAWLLRYVSNHNFRGFGVYRIIIGIIIIGLALFTTLPLK